MKLRVLSPKTLTSCRRTLSTVNFSKIGVVSLSGAFCEAAGIDESRRVCIAQDESRPTDFYIYLDEEGFELRKKEDAKCVLFQSSALCQEINKAVGRRGTFLVATQPTAINGRDYYAILTKSNPRDNK